MGSMVRMGVRRSNRGVNYNSIMNSPEEKNFYYTQLKSFLTDAGLIKHGIHINDIEAVVEYKCRKKVRKSNALVSFNMESVDHCGDIEIDSDAFPSSTFHTGFSTAWQSYTYDETDKSLKIKGSSPKMGGEYVVVITIA